MIEIKAVKYVVLPGTPLSAQEIAHIEQRMLDALRRGVLKGIDQMVARECSGHPAAPCPNIPFFPEA